jgi:hypothetical protein
MRTGTVSMRRQCILYEAYPDPVIQAQNCENCEIIYKWDQSINQRAI